MLRFVQFATAPALAFALLAASPAAAPQVQATAVTKSGERHTGINAWTRVDKGEFALRKSQHDELRVPATTIAYVDFGGTADTNPNISGSQWALVLRNGQVVRGQLIEMGHTDRSDTSSPYIVSFRDESGQERRFQGNEVGRVYFPGGANTSGGGTTKSKEGIVGQSAGNASTATSQGGDIVVDSRQQWTATGLTVRRNETLTFNSSGTIQISADQNDVATVAGAKNGRNPAASAPQPQLLAGALIGRIGNGPAFAIGDQTSLPMPASGQLFLGINDDSLGDNQGEFRVTITRGSSILRRR